MTEDERFKIWAAGFFDGEGSVTLFKRGLDSYVLGVKLTSTAKKAVDMFYSAWGGAVFPYRRQRIKSGALGKQAWQVTYDENEAYQLVLDLLPYVELKRPQFELAKEFIEKVRDLRSLRSGSSHKQTNVERVYRKRV